MATKRQIKAVNKIEKLFNDFNGRYIYLIKCHNYFKIGIAHNLDNRLNTLQCGNPYELELIWAAKIMDSKYVEDLLHQVFKEKRCFREWFELNKDDVLFITSLLELTKKGLKGLEEELKNKRSYENKH